MARVGALLARVAAALAALASLAACGDPMKPCDQRIEAGDYLLCIQVLHAGTRSEGRIGRLFLRGAELRGGQTGETIDVQTPAGPVRFTYLGEARPHLWSKSGWALAGAP